MSNTTKNLGSPMGILPLRITEQTHIKGGMAATEEEKRAKIKKRK
jgi:hypothetical protein